MSGAVEFLNVTYGGYNVSVNQQLLMLFGGHLRCVNDLCPVGVVIRDFRFPAPLKRHLSSSEISRSIDW